MNRLSLVLHFNRSILTVLAIVHILTCSGQTKKLTPSIRDVCAWDAHLGENRREGHPRRQCEVLHVVIGVLTVTFAALSSPSEQQSPAPPQVNPLPRSRAPGGRVGRGRGGGGPVGLRGVTGDVGGPVHRKGARWS